jgi:tripartite ATP-independent transporter DctM subunit
MDVTVLIIIIGIFFLCMLLGMPVALAMGWSTLAYFLMQGNPYFYLQLARGMYNGIDNFVLMAVPFFMLAGELMNLCGLTDRIMHLADELAGKVRGSLAYANMIGSFLFAGISGAAVSDVAALGSIEIPAMVKQGYDEPFAAAITATSSLVGPIIPPSIIMVIYGSIMGVSIAGLFAAGILPGLLFLFIDFVYVGWLARKRNYPKREHPTSIRKIAGATRDSALALIMPFIIIGGILGGIFTPTEAATVAVFYAFILGLVVYRKLNVTKVWNALLHAAVKSSYIFLIIAVAISFKWVLSILQLPASILELLQGVSDNKWIVITLVNIFFIFIGMFFETGAAVILFGPIFAPAMATLGFDPLHFGIVMIVNLCIGLCTPPLGVCLYAACSISDVSLEQISKEATPFILHYLGVLCIITYFPAVTLWLPRLFGY